MTPVNTHCLLVTAIGHSRSEPSLSLHSPFLSAAEQSHLFASTLAVRGSPSTAARSIRFAPVLSVSPAGDGKPQCARLVWFSAVRILGPTKGEQAMSNEKQDVYTR